MPTVSRVVLVVASLVLLGAITQDAKATIFFGNWNVTDGSVFGASYVTTIRSADGYIASPTGGYVGSQDPLAGSGVGHGPMSSSSAFRLGVMSEFFLDLAVGYLENQGQLPFSRSAPIPMAYLPTSLQSLLNASNAGVSFLFNPRFGSLSSFVSLNMLLQHTSSLNEEGFLAYGTMQGPLDSTGNASLPTRAVFLENLFAGAGADTFSLTCQPSSAINVWAQSGCFNYSRTNTALAGFVVETILSVQQLAITNLETYVYTNILAPLELSSTFILDKHGLMPLPTYPPGLGDDTARQMYTSTAMANLNYTWSGAVSSFTLAADPFSDLMIYTTSQDLQRLMANVLLPGSAFYTAFGVDKFRAASVQLTSTGDAVAAADIPNTMRFAGVNGAVSRGLGLVTVNLTDLCHEVQTQVVSGCDTSAWNVSSDTNAYGMGSTTAFGQVAILCTSNTYYGTDVCVGAQVTYTDSSTFLPIRYMRNLAMSVAFIQLQTYMLNSYKPSTPKVIKLMGLWIVIGVVAAIVLTVVLSYLTDYFVQPLPPAKAIAPVPGARGLGAETGWGAGGGGGAGGNAMQPNALSPLPAVNLFADTEDDSLTPPRQASSVTHGNGGSSTSGRRGRRYGAATGLSIDGSTSSSGRSRRRPHGGAGGDSTSGSSSGPRSVVRFDAYI